MAGKRSLRQWIFIYLLLGLIVYGFIYVAIFTKKGDNTYVSPMPSNLQNFRSITR